MTETFDVDVGQGSASDTELSSSDWLLSIPIITHKEGSHHLERQKEYKVGIEDASSQPPSQCRHAPPLWHGGVLTLLGKCGDGLALCGQMFGVPVTEQRASCLGRRLWVWLLTLSIQGVTEGIRDYALSCKPSAGKESPRG